VSYKLHFQEEGKEEPQVLLPWIMCQYYTRPRNFQEISWLIFAVENIRNWCVQTIRADTVYFHLTNDVFKFSHAKFRSGGWGWCTAYTMVYTSLKYTHRRI